MFCQRCRRQIDGNMPFCEKCILELADKIRAEKDLDEKTDTAIRREGCAPSAADSPCGIHTENITKSAPESATVKTRADVNKPPNLGNPTAPHATVARRVYPGAVPNGMRRPPEQVPSKPINYRMYGFGMALTSTILAFFAFIFLFVFTESIIVSGTMESFVGGVIFFGAPMAILALTFGIISIVRFKKIRKQGLPSPIATLVMGIFSVSYTGIAVLYSLGFSLIFYLLYF